MMFFTGKRYAVSIWETTAKVKKKTRNHMPTGFRFVELTE